MNTILQSLAKALIWAGKKLLRNHYEHIKSDDFLPLFPDSTEVKMKQNGIDD